MTESPWATMNWCGSKRTLRATSEPGGTIPITFNGMIHFADALTDGTDYLVDLIHQLHDSRMAREDINVHIWK